MKPVLVLQHTGSEGPGRLLPFAKNHGLNLNILDLEKNSLPLPSPKSFSAIIVLGGPMNVYEEEKYPFLRPETQFIRETIEQQIPFLGICLGGQLLAKATGGCVTKNPFKEIGNFWASLTEKGLNDPLFKGIPEKIPVFQWHGDTFSEMGQGILLATSKACPHQAFRIGSFAYGLQFHVETTPELAQKWFTEYDPELAAEGLDANKILREFLERETQYQQISHRLFDNFFRIAGIL